MTQNAQNILSDLSTLTKVSSKTLTTLTGLESLCISSAIADAKIQEADTIQLNIGLGILSVALDTMTCKFMPSAQLKHNIKRAIDGKVDPLENTLEEAMIAKLTAACEELI